MINILYRAFYAAFGVIPIFFGFLCAGNQTVGELLFNFVSGLLILVIVSKLFQVWVDKIVRDQPKTEIKIRSVSQRRSSPALYFVAYVSPFILSEKIGILTIVIIGIFLFFMFLLSESEYDNPIFNLTGFRFYDITDSLNMTYLLMSNKSIHSFMNKNRDLKNIQVVTINDGFYIQVE